MSPEDVSTFIAPDKNGSSHSDIQKKIMISKALQFTASVLDQFIKNRLELDESKVQLNTLIESNGDVPQENSNKVVISLINIEKETARPYYVRNHKVQDGSYADVNPSQRFNLDILISSNFEDYGETLKFLDEVILFFQANPCIDSSTSSSIPKGLVKLEFDTEKINYHQMQGLWTAMGAKYQPSIIYKMRLITVQAFEAEMFVQGVRNTSTSVTS
jgi:hypothetical protein